MYRAQLIATGVAGTPWYTNLYFDDSTGGTPQEIADALSLFLDDVNTRYMSTVSWRVSPEMATVDEADGTITAVTSVTTVAKPGGTSAGQMLSKASQINIRLSTGVYLQGRQVQGKFYFGGLAASVSTSAGNVAASAVLAFDTAFASIADPAEGIQPVVWSRPRVILGLPVNGSAYPVTAHATQSEFAVLRSRRD